MDRGMLELIQPLTRVEKEDFPKFVEGIYNSIPPLGVDIEVSKTKVREPGQQYKSGPNEGTYRPDKIYDNYFLSASGLFYASWSDRRLNYWTKSGDALDFQYDITSLKRWLKEISHA